MTHSSTFSANKRSSPIERDIAEPAETCPVGRRIHVIGNSSSGKSTLAKRLAHALDADFVELDALNWLPGWVGLNETDPEELERRFRHATRGDDWVVAGSYSGFSQRSYWSRLETVIWLDLPMLVLLKRHLARSWRRARSRELLWGTNVEGFWEHFLVWRKEKSLIYWIVTQHGRKRRQMRAWIADERWAHIRFVRLKSGREADAFARSVEAAVRTPTTGPGERYGQNLQLRAWHAIRSRGSRHP